MMVRKASLVTFLAFCFGSAVILYIHQAQQEEIRDLKRGVERDLERRKFKQMLKEQQMNDKIKINENE